MYLMNKETTDRSTGQTTKEASEKDGGVSSLPAPRWLLLTLT